MTLIKKTQMVVALLAMLAFSSYGNAQPAKESKPPKLPAQNTETSKEGKILVVRGAEGGEAQLTEASGNKVLLVGEWREELLRLDGHKIKAWGQADGKKLLVPAWRATRYEILDSGGRKPLVGILQKGEAGHLSLQVDGATTALNASKALSKKLSERHGCRVWIVGDLEGKSVKVNKFGWLSCKQEKPMQPAKPIQTAKEEKK